MVVASPAKASSREAPKATKPRARRVRRTNDCCFGTRLFGLAARLFAWYAIVTILFRCPATPADLTPTHDSALCKTYFDLRAHISPHFEPYYTTYAAPYVDTLTPYYQRANALVFTPATAAAKKYAGPRLTAAQEYAAAQYEAHVKPSLARYEHAARAHYQEKVHPVVSQASAVVAPYVAVAADGAKATYREVLTPAYVAVSPYAVTGYEMAAQFTKETAVPGVQWAARKVVVFVDGAVWPHLQTVYGEHIEPQLTRIGQRLGRYGGKTTTGLHKAKTTHRTSTTGEAKSSSFVKPPQQSSSRTGVVSDNKSDPTVAISSTFAEAQAEAQAEATQPSLIFASYSRPSPIEAPEASDDESEVRHNARLEVAADLKEWQERFTKAADEGAAEIDSLIHDITEEILTSPLMQVGHDLLAQLEEVIAAELAGLKKNLLTILGKAEDYATAAEDFNTEVAAIVRTTGLSIKNQANEVRIWREEFENQLQAAITSAADAHFKTLETMRDLALQKIGMKWAWMDGITYKDWAKYHELRDRFDAWTDDLKAMIVTHSELQETLDYANTLEDKAMDLTRGAVKSLSGIREVSGTKFLVKDTEDDWEITSVKKRAEAKAQKELDEAVARVVAHQQKEREQRLATKAKAEVEVEVEAEAEVAAREAEGAAEIIKFESQEPAEAEFTTQVDPPVATESIEAEFKTRVEKEDGKEATTPEPEAESQAQKVLVAETEEESFLSIQTEDEAEVSSMMMASKSSASAVASAVKEIIGGKDEL